MTDQLLNELQFPNEEPLNDEPQAPATESAVPAEETQEPVESPAFFAEDATVEEAVILPELEDESPSELLYEEEEIKEKPVRRRSRAFRIGFTIFTLLLLVGVVIGLWQFRDALANYEAGIQAPPIEAYLDLIKSGDFEELYEASGYKPTLLNSKEDHIAYLKTLYENVGELSYTKQPTGDSTLQRYHLYSNGKTEVATLLVKQDVDKDGKTVWYITTELAYQPTYTITASDDMDLLINGQRIQFLTEQNVTATEMQTTIFNFPTDVALPVIRTYTINGLLVPPHIVATGLSGQECVRHENGRNIVLMLADDETDRQEHETLATDFITAHFTTGSDRLYELNVSEYSRYSESDFTCSVTCAEVTTTENGTISVGDNVVTYGMTFLKDGETWKLCSLTVDGVDQPIPESTPEPPVEE